MQFDTIFIDKPVSSLEKFDFTSKNETLPINPRARTLLIERYGTLDAFVADLTAVASDGFGKPRPEADVRKHVLAVDRLYLVFDRQNEPVLAAFGSFDHYRINNTGIVYINGIVIRQKYQRNGIFSKVTEMEISNQKETAFLAGRTQNPVIYHCIHKLVKKIAPTGETIPPELLVVAKHIVRTRGLTDLNPETLIGRATYGECLYGNVPDSPPKSFFDNQLRLNYNKGDSVLVVGSLK